MPIGDLHRSSLYGIIRDLKERSLFKERPMLSSFHQSHFVWKSTRKAPYAEPATPVLCEFAQSKCIRIIQKSHFASFCPEIYKENAGRFSRGQRFASACAVEMHMDMSEEASCAEIYRENAGPVYRDKHFVRACAVEMHMPDASETTSIEHWALTVSARTPQCDHTVWGSKLPSLSSSNFPKKTRVTSPSTRCCRSSLEQHLDTQHKNDAGSTCQDIEDTPGGGLPLQLEILQRG